MWDVSFAKRRDNGYEIDFDERTDCMETIYLNRDNLKEWQQKAEQNVMALGFFDGIHYGHLEVIQTAIRIAREKKLSLSVMSFFPHPKVVISNGKEQVNYLMPISEKEKIFKSLGVDTFYIVTFDKTFAQLSPEEFVADYLTSFSVVHAVAGFDFTYGSRGSGNFNRLKRDSGGQIEATQVKKVECEGVKVSSTCIREMLLQGKVEQLPAFLGRPYEVKCEWDGFSLNLSSYYSLPAPGRYLVTLKKGMQSIPSEMIVMEDKGGHLLKSMIKIPLFMKGKISIVWHRRILEENVQTHHKTNRILSTI